MKDFMEQLTYRVEFLLNGQLRSVVLVPLDAANGVIMDDPTNNGYYNARTLAGSNIQIPVAAVTNVFASWWKVSTNDFGGNGNKVYHAQTDWVEGYVEDKMDDPKAWDKETGELKGVEGEDHPPPDTPPSRKLFGRR